MKNVRVAHLSDLLSTIISPIWVKSPYGVTRVERVQQAREVDEPDIRLVGGDKVIVGEFEDQRVKLDLDEMRVDVKDIRGVTRTLSFSACAPA